MPDAATPQEALPPSAVSVDDLLARLLSTYKKPAKGAKPAAGKKLPRNAKPIPFAHSYAEKKTGYRVWKATHRVVQIEEQTCSCCGEITLAVKGEFFALENGTAHAVWLRTEAYGIEAQENLPVERVFVEPRIVSACAHCIEIELALRSVFPSPQLSFDF